MQKLLSNTKQLGTQAFGLTALALPLFAGVGTAYAQTDDMTATTTMVEPTTPGVPSTGAAADTTFNTFILAVAALVILLGILYLGRRFFSDAGPQ